MGARERERHATIGDVIRIVESAQIDQYLLGGQEFIRLRVPREQTPPPAPASADPTAHLSGPRCPYCRERPPCDPKGCPCEHATPCPGSDAEKRAASAEPAAEDDEAWAAEAMTRATYPIAAIFHSLQGEGHFVGSPMVFVRLGGCSVLDCHIRAECDEAPWRMRERLSTTEVLARVLSVGHRQSIVCITGGEPTDHDLVPLVAALRDAGHRVHLETSGARPIVGLPLEWITVSPKSSGYAQRTGHTLKIVVRPDWSDAEAWAFASACDAGASFFHRYLQPLTNVASGASNLEQVLRMLLSDKNESGRWALSTQAHRVWRLP